nr:proline-rich receptor-like protein kinase PERK8 [Ipomoea batatas]
MDKNAPGDEKRNIEERGMKRELEKGLYLVLGDGQKADLNICEYDEGLQVSGVPYAPLQQYCGSPKASHALLQATLSPAELVTFSADGQSPFTSTLHPVLVQLSPVPPCGTTSIGSVAGGAAFPPAHSTWPEPQSPVTHVNFPVESCEQCVLPQNRPPQLDGTLTVLDSPACKANPVVSNGATPALISSKMSLNSRFRFNPHLRTTDLRKLETEQESRTASVPFSEKKKKKCAEKHKIDLLLLNAENVN